MLVFAIHTGGRGYKFKKIWHRSIDLVL